MGWFKPRKFSGVHAIKGSRFDQIFDGLIMLLGILLLVLFVYPVYFVIIASFSDPVAVANGRAWILPRDITWMGYEEIFKKIDVWIGYQNTLFYTVGGTLFSLLCTLTAAYALSRKDLPFRRIINFFFLFTMFFGGGLMPTYLTLKDFQLLDTPWVMIVPFAVNVFNMVIARTFFETTIPEELLEAAKLDGCTYSYFFVRIVIPLSKAIIAVIALYYAVSQWNDYFRALLYIKDRKLIPLQLVLREILITNQQTQQSSLDTASRQRLADILKYGLIVVSTMPVMMIYPFIQKYFTQGVMIGAIKG